jgi:peptide-methionine (S)-S-oxide reductase
MESAMFGAGCFWGVEAAFKAIPGVVKTAVGYAGGHTKNPTYRQVCTNTTGHAEVVRLDFDPMKVSYAELLKVFFDNHNPTQLNRQGPDVGSQYRSVIFFCGEAQRQAAEEAKAQLAASGKFEKPIVTAIEPAPEFTRAEEYHQDYFAKNNLAHCPV